MHHGHNNTIHQLLQLGPLTLHEFDNASDKGWIHTDTDSQHGIEVLWLVALIVDIS